jgi:hypothetical protein
MLSNIVLVMMLSTMFSIVIVYLSNNVEWMIYKSGIGEVQKFHAHHTSRVGGIPVFVRLLTE